jgi:WD40 repeat protein/serine/threonine protein kinase/tetratricopeptide (TPR) repeat protein
VSEETAMSLNEEAVFAEALEIPDPQERAAYLDRACAGNLGLRHNVESLLAAYAAGQFLEAPAPPPAATVDEVPLRERPGTVIGPYKLLQLIGEGGMGAVFMAEQTQPVRRKVALKIIKPGMDSRQVLARFEAERQVLALMDHPHIAKVFDGGATPDGRPYFVMELVKGRPLTQYCDEHRLTPRQRLELFVSVCQAVQHAHQKGVIHRDLKPSNVLVAPYDGRPVVKVIDFGVAKAAGQRLTERTLFTEFGAVVGTLEYMSPEQAELNNQDIDTRSDIYSLGVLLYELLTGTTPLDRARLRQAAFTEMLRIIREEEPPRPSTRLSASKEALPSISARRQTEPAKLTKLVRGELDWIVMKALEKDRGRRYETANGLALDLERYLNDEPVLACPPSAGYRLRKVLRRNKRLIVTGAALVLVLLVGSVLSLWQAVRATRSEANAVAGRDAAERARKDAQTADAENRRIVARQYVANGARLLEQGNRTDALVWFVEALRKDAADADRVAMHRRRIAAVAQLCPRPEQLWFHPAPVSQALFSPDGRRVLTVSGTEARLWDLATSQAVLLTHTAPILHVEFFGPGRLLTYSGVAASSQKVDETGAILPAVAGEARVWDAATGQALAPPLKHDLMHADLGQPLDKPPTLSPDGQWLLTITGMRFQTVEPRGWRGGEARVWETATGKPVMGPLKLEGGVQEASFSPDGGGVYTANQRQARLWDAATGQPITAEVSHGDPKLWQIRAHSFSADGKQLFMTFDNRPLLTFDFGHAGEEKEAVTRGWDARTGKPLGDARKLAIELFVGTFDTIHMNAQRVLVMPGKSDGRLFDALTGQPVGAPLKLDKGLYHSDLAGVPGRRGGFTPDGKRLFIGYRRANFIADSSRGEARLWDAPTGQPLTPPLMLESPVQQYAFSGDGRRLLLVEGAKTARVWDAATGRPLTPPIRHEGQEIKAVLGPDGGRVLTAAGNEARVWDAVSGRPLTPLLNHNGPVQAACFNPEGSHILTASKDGTARLWPVTAGEPPTRRLDHDSPVATAQFSPDGRAVLSTTEQLYPIGLPPTARLWDALTDQPRSPALRYVPRVYNPLPQFSSDGRWLAIVNGKEVRLWDATTNRPTGAPLVHDAYVCRVEFTPDSRELLTLQTHANMNQSGKLEAKIWDVATGQARNPPITMLAPDPVQVRVLLSPDGRRLVVYNQGAQMQLWDLRTSQSIAAPLPKTRPLAFSPDSRRLLVATSAQAAQLLDARTGQSTGPPLAHDGPVSGGTFLPDGRTLVTFGSGEIRRWDVATGQRLVVALKVAKTGTPQLSPDGLSACLADGPEVYVLDLTTGRPATLPIKHPARVNDVRFTPDGRALLTFCGPTVVESHAIREGGIIRASSRALGEVRLWDARTGEPLLPSLLHLTRNGFLPMRGCPVLSRDGRCLLLAGDMKSLEVWDLPLPDPRGVEELVQLAQALSGRRFDEAGGPVPLGTDQWALVRTKVPEAGTVHRFDVASWHRREAIRCMDAKDWSGAIPHLDRLIAARPKEWRAYYYRGRCRSELGDYQASVADNGRAIELGADDYRCWNNRGLAHWRLGNWKAAADDNEKVVTTFPDSDYGGPWFQLIRARARQGDAAGYRRACTGFMDRWGKGADPNTLAWLCVLAPDALADPGQIVQLAERAYKQSPTTEVCNTLGAALYRAGKWKRAVETLDKNQGAFAASDWLFLAMAHHRLGHADKAREFLEKAVTWMDAARQGKAIFPSTGKPPDYTQRVEMGGLRREAEALLKSNKP